jgi:hypothetical protein
VKCFFDFALNVLGEQSQVKKQKYDDEILTQYLLGSLTEEETERLDELSVADDEIAARLQVIENEMVDAYARGELSGETLERFESFYPASPKRREKVSFARSFLDFAGKTGTAPATDAKQVRVPGTRRSSGESSERVSRFRFFVVPRLALQWGFAAAALLLLLVGGYLMFENLRLRNQMAQTQAERKELEQSERDLQRQLAEQRSSDAETEKELSRVRERLAQLEQSAPDQQNGNGEPRDLKIIAFNLSPQARGIGQIPTLAVPKGTDYVALTLELEVDEFPAYQAALKNPATGQIIWRSGKLKPGGKSKAVRVRLPASLLNAQNYTMELSRISASGVDEIVSSYPFRVVTQ